MSLFSLDHAKQFLEALGSKMPGDNKFTFQTFGDGTHRRSSKETRKRLNRIRHGTFEEYKDELINLNQQGAGIFVTINFTNPDPDEKASREIEDIRGLRAAFIDADNINLIEIFKQHQDIDNCYPNIITKSKRGLHAYWLLDRWEDINRFTPLQIALIEKFKTDPKVKDLARVMRLPGFYHLKDVEGQVLSKKQFEESVQKELATKVTIEHIDTFCNVSGFKKDGSQRSGDREGYRIERIVELLDLHIDGVIPPTPKKITHQPTSHFPHEFKLYLAQNYLYRIVPPTKGSGHAHETVGSACRVGHDFDVDSEAFWPILLEWGFKCTPPFNEQDLRYEYDSFLKVTKYPPGNKLYDSEYDRDAQHRNWQRAQGFDVAAVGDVYRDDDVPWSDAPDRPARFIHAHRPPTATPSTPPFPPDFPAETNPLNESLDPIDEHMLKDEQARIQRSIDKQKIEKKKQQEQRQELAKKGPAYLIWDDFGEPPQLTKTKDGRYKMRPQHPRETSWHFLNTMCNENGIRTLHFHNDRFVQWDGVRYQKFKPEGYRRRPAQFLAKCAEETEKEDDDGNFKFTQFKVNQKRKSELLEALRDLVSLNEEVYQAPCWLIDDERLPNPQEIIVCQNGLFDVRNNKLLPPNPAFFTLNSLTINYNPDAPRPIEFLKFLDSVFGNDDESKKLLKWWFGYCLTQDTHHQKMLMLVGESRSGKGVITRLLEQLVGPHSYGSMKFHRLAGTFSLSSAIDKTVLVFPDARIGGKIDQSAVVADLLSITGEDKMFIDRKNLDPISIKLNCRIMTVSNEPLKLHETSGALQNRILLINFPKGREELEQDRKLEKRISKELPGILNWAIDGWNELQKAEHFFQPESGHSQLDVFSAQSSPIKQFIEDLCEKGQNESVQRKIIFDVWSFWATCMKYKPGNIAAFGKNLMTALPNLKSSRPKDGESRVRKYNGVSVSIDKFKSFVENDTNYDPGVVNKLMKIEPKQEPFKEMKEMVKTYDIYPPRSGWN